MIFWTKLADWMMEKMMVQMKLTVTWIVMVILVVETM